MYTSRIKPEKSVYKFSDDMQCWFLSFFNNETRLHLVGKAFSTFGMAPKLT